jgi:hypothetical protein
MGRLSADLSREIAQLSNVFNLTVREETYEPDHFGDASLVLAGPSVSFRIIRDKSEVFLDVRGAADDWIDVRGILGSLGLLTASREIHTVGELVAIVSANTEVFARRIAKT